MNFKERLDLLAATEEQQRIVREGRDRNDSIRFRKEAGKTIDPIEQRLKSLYRPLWEKFESLECEAVIKEMVEHLNLREQLNYGPLAIPQKRILTYLGDTCFYKHDGMDVEEYFESLRESLASLLRSGQSYPPKIIRKSWSQLVTDLFKEEVEPVRSGPTLSETITGLQRLPDSSLSSEIQVSLEWDKYSEDDSWDGYSSSKNHSSKQLTVTMMHRRPTPPTMTFSRPIGYRKYQTFSYNVGRIASKEEFGEALARFFFSSPE